MIDLDFFLKECLIQGTELWVEGERLQVRPPQGGLSADKLALLSQYESEMVRLLPTFSFEMPLSYGQEALWIAHENAQNKGAHNIAVVVHIKNGVDKALLRDVLQKISQRHLALRTTIAIKNGQPKQVIHATQTVYFEEVDCSGQPSEMVMQALEQAHQYPFNLSEGPLWRVSLVTQYPDRQVLLLNFHHIIFDGSCHWMLLDELLPLYAAGGARRLPTLAWRINLPPITRTYAQFVPWQREMLETRGEHLRAYWQEALGGNLPVLELPTDHPRPKIPTSETGNLPFDLSSDLRDQLRALARREGVSFYTVLLAAFQLLLARYSSAERILVGVPTAGREPQEFAQTFGYFVNPIVVDATLTNVPFTTFLSQVRAKLSAAVKHRAYPFPWVVRNLSHIERDTSRGPIFQAMLTVQRPQNLAEKTVALLRGKSVQLANPNGATDLQLEFGGWMQMVGQSDIMFDLIEQATPRGLGGKIRYRKDLFEEETIKRLDTHYKQLLEAIVSDATQPIYQLPLLTEAERHQILVEWNETGTDYPRDNCIHELFEEQVERTPDAIAVVFGEASLTYRALNRKANQLAHYLQSLGVGPEVLVAICVERSLEMLVGVLAILKAGGAYVPLDPAYPEERLAFMLQDADVSVLLTQERLRESLPPTSAQIVSLDGNSSRIATQHHENPAQQVAPHHLAYILYTSGSTGRPKGVMIEHRSPTALICWGQRVYSQAELAGVLASTSVCFDLSVYELFLPLSVGGKVILAENALHLPEMRHKEQVTLVNTVPSAMQELVRRQAIPASVQTINLAGEPLRRELVDQLYAIPTVQKVYDLYGPSEDTTYSTFKLREQAGAVTIGKPLDNTQAYILDANNQPLPVGVPGQLHLGGVGLSRGYLNRPELTGEKFIPNPFGPGKLYKTGDLVRYLPNGDIEFLGRIDHQVKIRGFRIELGEIESVLRQHPTIQETVVVAREALTPSPSPNNGRGEKQLVAYVAPVESAAHEELSIPALRIHLKQSLPDYMVPAAFVLLDRLPLTPNGKIDRKALPAPSRRPLRQAQGTASTGSGTGHEWQKPRTPTEERVANIWAELLGIERVGINDSFFELGGHSLLATQVVSRIALAFGLDLSIQALFKGPTIAQLAERIEDDLLVLALSTEASTFSEATEEEEFDTEEFVL